MHFLRFDLPKELKAGAASVSQIMQNRWEESIWYCCFDRIETTMNAGTATCTLANSVIFFCMRTLLKCTRPKCVFRYGGMGNGKKSIHHPHQPCICCWIHYFCHWRLPSIIHFLFSQAHVVRHVFNTLKFFSPALSCLRKYFLGLWFDFISSVVLYRTTQQSAYCLWFRMRERFLIFDAVCVYVCVCVRVVVAPNQRT